MPFVLKAVGDTIAPGIPPKRLKKYVAVFQQIDPDRIGIDDINGSPVFCSRALACFQRVKIELSASALKSVPS